MFTVRSVTGLLELDERVERDLGVAQSFWIAIALTYLDFLEDREVRSNDWVYRDDIHGPLELFGGCIGLNHISSSLSYLVGCTRRNKLAIAVDWSDSGTGIYSTAEPHCTRVSMG